MEEIDSDNLLVDEWDRVALYKISKLYCLELPPPDVHVYLAGTIEKFQKLDAQAISSNIVDSSDTLDELVEREDGNPEHIELIYFIARSTGDYQLNLNAQISTERDLPFLIECYRLAKIYGSKIGRTTEPKIFHTISQEPKKYVDLLAVYYRHPNLTVTVTDILNFKEYVKQLKDTSISPCPIKLVKPSKKEVKRINKEKKSN